MSFIKKKLGVNIFQIKKVMKSINPAKSGNKTITGAISMLFTVWLPKMGFTGSETKEMIATIMVALASGYTFIGLAHKIIKKIKEKREFNKNNGS